MSRYRCIAVEKVNHAVSLLCRVLGVSRSGYYAWDGREPSARKRHDAELGERIRQIHRESRGTNGVPRVHAALTATGSHTSRKRVARLMRQDGLSGQRGRRRVRTTIVDRNALGDRMSTPASR